MNLAVARNYFTSESNPFIKLRRLGEKLLYPIASWLHYRGVTANQVTGVRGLSPLLIGLTLQQKYFSLAFIIYLTAAITDGIDGIMAKKLEMKERSAGG